jgi:hypothetical protein
MIYVPHLPAVHPWQILVSEAQPDLHSFWLLRILDPTRLFIAETVGHTSMVDASNVLESTTLVCTVEMRFGHYFPAQLRSGVYPDWSRVLPSPTGTLNEYPIHTMDKLDNGGILQRFRRLAMQDSAVGTSQRFAHEQALTLRVALTRGEAC